MKNSLAKTVSILAIATVIGCGVGDLILLAPPFISKCVAAFVLAFGSIVGAILIMEFMENFDGGRW